MVILKENDKIGQYSVQYFIKEGLFNSTYKVVDNEGKAFFLKLFDRSLVPSKMIDDDSDTIKEILYCRKIKHENVISYEADGNEVIDGQRCDFLVSNFFSGHLLSEVIARNGAFSAETTKNIGIGIMRGVEYLDETYDLSHNDITPRNIILDEVEKGQYVPRIIDMGHISKRVGGSPSFPTEDLSLEFCAPETFVGSYSGKSDVFSTAALMYFMLTGRAPWPCELGDGDTYASKKSKVRKARKKELDIESLKNAGADEELINIIVAGLTIEFEKRPYPAKYIKILTGEQSAPEASDQKDDSPRRRRGPEEQQGEQQATSVNVEFQQTTGGGFADVAGMEKLKEELSHRVIWVLKDKEKAAKYRLTPPNGMILYGPPGCGKTYFAQKFAEESHFNFCMVSGSDLGSVYVHGTQGKIASLFKEARAKAPTIICFDEFDAFVPARGSEDASHKADEVNEFLAQLNNCSKDGIFVIGTTNRLDMIDPAVLRKGRMDLHVEIPAPDAETRKMILKLHMKDRPAAEDIDYDELAMKTDNYAASDLAFIVNEAAMVAALADADITQQHLENAIKSNPSSLAPTHKRTPIGY